MKYIGGIEVLSKPVLQELQKHISRNEKIQQCVSIHSNEPSTSEKFMSNTIFGERFLSNWLNAIVALDHRLICLDGKNCSGIHLTSRFELLSILI